MVILFGFLGLICGLVVLLKLGCSSNKRQNYKRDLETNVWLDSFNDLMNLEVVDDIEKEPRRKEEWNPIRR